METLESLGGNELAAVAAIWVAQKRELIVAFGGTSMSPTIAPGQTVLLRCGVMPEIGEVAAFIFGNQVAVHRVVAMHERGGWLVTWGDANPFPDDPTDANRIVGTISRIERDGSMQSLEAAPLSLYRRAILRFAVRRDDLAATRRRVGLLYRIRANLALGPGALTRKIFAKLFC